MQGPEGVLEAACAIHSDRQAVTTCSRCGTFSCQECLSESPSGKFLCAACVARETSQLPWDYREELGWARAWFKSVSAILLRPTMTFSTAKSEGDVSGSLLFMAISWFAGCFTSFATFAAIGAWLPSLIETPKREESFGLVIATMYGVMAVVVPLMGMAGSLVMAGLDHLLMLMSGKPRGFETTLRASALSLAPYALGLIPICSLYVAPIWVLVVKVFAYKEMHRTTIGVAVLGALAVPGLIVLLGCGFYALALALALMSAQG
ncbi:MAG TPA: YIP1 family protein [Hyalangium sp.]|nr:YIP1 family protein [Hyalangium sp.]